MLKTNLKKPGEAILQLLVIAVFLGVRVGTSCASPLEGANNTLAALTPKSSSLHVNVSIEDNFQRFIPRFMLLFGDKKPMSPILIGNYRSLGKAFEPHDEILFQAEDGAFYIVAFHVGAMTRTIVPAGEAFTRAVSNNRDYLSAHLLKNGGYDTIAFVDAYSQKIRIRQPYRSEAVDLSYAGEIRKLLAVNTDSEPPDELIAVYRDSLEVLFPDTQVRRSIPLPRDTDLKSVIVFRFPQYPFPMLISTDVSKTELRWHRVEPRGLSLEGKWIGDAPISSIAPLHEQGSSEVIVQSPDGDLRIINISAVRDNIERLPESLRILTTVELHSAKRAFLYDRSQQEYGVLYRVGGRSDFRPVAGGPAIETVEKVLTARIRGRSESVILVSSEERMFYLGALSSDSIIQDARVVLNDTETHRSTAGQFLLIENLQPATYRITASLLGYSFRPDEYVREVRAGETARASFVYFYPWHKAASLDRPCIGYHPDTYRWGTLHSNDHTECPDNYGVVATDDSTPGRDEICCPLPFRNVLTNEYHYTVDVCDKNYIQVGSTWAPFGKEEPMFLCRKVDTSRFKFTAPSGGQYWGFGSNMPWSNTLSRDEIPVYYRYAVARRSHRRFDTDGCIGSPIGSVLVSRNGSDCVNQRYVEIIPIKPDTEQLLFSPNKCRGITNIFDPLASCSE